LSSNLTHLCFFKLFLLTRCTFSTLRFRDISKFNRLCYILIKIIVNATFLFTWLSLFYFFKTNTEKILLWNILLNFLFFFSNSFFAVICFSFI
jgi:hypothetical protein